MSYYYHTFSLEEYLFSDPFFRELARSQAFLEQGKNETPCRLVAEGRKRLEVGACQRQTFSYGLFLLPAELLPHVATLLIHLLLGNVFKIPSNKMVWESTCLIKFKFT